MPRIETLVAGVVEPYRQSDLSFDVSGVLEAVVDVGEPAEGAQLDGRGGMLRDEQGEPIREATVLAEIAENRFQQSVDAAELSLASTDRQIESMRVELETVFPARVSNAKSALAAATADVTSASESVAAAESELELARITVERDRRLIGSGSIAQSVLDQSESAFTTAAASVTRAEAALESARQGEQSAVASLAEAEGSLRVRQADLESLRASRAELVNRLEQAETDFDARILLAPFQGRVTRRYVERGAFINAGTPVVQLTMETAVKVVITVSAEQERQIAIGMQMPVYADAGSGTQYPATVFEKASVADAGTRTFRIGLILPNPIEGVPGESDFVSLGDLFPVLSLPATSGNGLFVNVASTFERDGQTFVLALSRETLENSDSATLQVPRAVPITFTDEWRQLDRATLRAIVPTDGLREGDPLLVSPKPTDEDGVRIGSPFYTFRPGDVVRVGLDAALPTQGLWLPTSAVIRRTGERLVFVVRDGVAQSIVVDVAETSGGSSRVIAEGLAEGDTVVVQGMQYLSDGDAVRASEGGATP
ncbi:MAG: HlyD family efflux transporter periplasmic adaptor subunit [Planctomycetota bacterium]